VSKNCSHPGCCRQLTGKLDTYGTLDAPLCYEHWREALDAIKAEFDQEVEARVTALQSALWTGMETGGDA